MTEFSIQLHGATAVDSSRLAPPPSEALIAMQARGLEIASPPSSTSPNQGPYSISAFSRSSDLDKPLPLEPHEKARRSSSVYTDASVETSITEIIQLYNGEEILSPSISPPAIHQPKAYRDTVAPLLQHRFSFSPSPESLKNASQSSKVQLVQEQEHSEQLREGSPASSAAYSRAAPTFQEFSRRLQEKRMETISPLTEQYNLAYGPVSPPLSDTEAHRRLALDSLESPPLTDAEIHRSMALDSLESPPLTEAEIHRRMALDSLAPPTLRRTPEIEMRAVEHNGFPFVSTPVSAIISDVDEDGLIPTPLSLSRATWYRKQAVVPFADTPPLTPRESRNSDKNANIAFAERPLRQGSHDTRSTDSFVVYASAAEAVKAMIKEKLKKKKILKGKDDLRSTHSERQSSWLGNQRANLEQGVSSIMRSLSTSEKTPDAKPRRQKQLAIQPTPYQRLGMAAYSPENKRKRHEERQRERDKARAASKQFEQRRLTTDINQRASILPKRGELADAFHSGQNQLVGALDGARSILTRNSSGRRREKLKQSITLVGPTTMPTGLVEGEERNWL